MMIPWNPTIGWTRISCVYHQRNDYLRWCNSTRSMYTWMVNNYWIMAIDDTFNFKGSCHKICDLGLSFIGQICHMK